MIFCCVYALDVLCTLPWYAGHLLVQGCLSKLPCTQSQGNHRAASSLLQFKYMQAVEVWNGLLQVLRQDEDFDALQWFDAVRAHYAAERARLKVCGCCKLSCCMCLHAQQAHRTAASVMTTRSTFLSATFAFCRPQQRWQRGRRRSARAWGSG